MAISLINFKLTEEEIEWFGNRLFENMAGKVIVPNHLFKKFRKIAKDETLENHVIRCYLITNCY